MAEWLVRETQHHLIAVGRRSDRRRSRIFANSRPFSFFSYCTLKLLFVVCSLVFAMRRFASVF